MTHTDIDTHTDTDAGFPTLILPDSNTATSTHPVRWRSEAGAPVPRRVVISDDRITADAAYRLACEGTAVLWRGDFQNARQLLQAMARRMARVKRTPRKHATATSTSPREAFHLHRQSQAQRARTLNMLLIELASDYSIALRRAPDVRLACEQAYGVAHEHGTASVVSLRELHGLIGAYEWRKKGVEVAALHARIHPHYGVFSPVRGEYVDLVARAPLPSPLPQKAFDIGTGTGVLAAVLAARGIREIVATEQSPRALACAVENIERLGYAQQVRVVKADLFPEGRASLVVCNPPWLPARAASPLERAVFDPDSQMLLGFLNGLKDYLEPDGEGWLILSDFAEHLGLRTRAMLLDAIDHAGLCVVGRDDTRPRHPKAADPDDPLYQARRAEVTSLWRLRVKVA
jgi:methylase of polypeptide subunit release factors